LLLADEPERLRPDVDRAALHKLSLSVFPHNAAAISLYRKFGFEHEGVRRKQVRRANGDLWDLVDMGLLLATE
jgi:RimJ/RimL family protein N-acetyltransferase